MIDLRVNEAPGDLLRVLWESLKADMLAEAELEVKIAELKRISERRMATERLFLVIDEF